MIIKKAQSNSHDKENRENNSDNKSNEGCDKTNDIVKPLELRCDKNIDKIPRNDKNIEKLQKIEKNTEKLQKCDKNNEKPKSAEKSQKEKMSSATKIPPDIIIDKKTNYRYKRSKFLGQGGFARCFLVECLENNQMYAAKTIDKENLRSQKIRQKKRKLKTEISIHKRLKHPHVVEFKSAFEDDEFVYLLLELCDNGTCVEWLRDKKRLSEKDLIVIIPQLLDALDYLHQQKVIHRDLKLGNIFLTKENKIKIGDFGLAAECKKGERKKTICGTPNYIAPEILFNKGHSYEVDLWSLGIILYTMLVGRPPFHTKDVKAIYQKIKENQYDFPDSVPLTENAKQLIRSLLHPEPEKRLTIEEIRTHPFISGSVSIVKKSSFIQVIYSNLVDGINSSTECPVVPIDPPTFVDKWIDDRGIRYWLTNDSCGLLKDQRHFLALPGGQLEVIENQFKESFTLNDYPTQWSTQVSTLIEMKKSISSSNANQPLVYVVKYLKTKHAMVFRLSHRVLQFDFQDKSKIIFYSEGCCLCYVDVNGGKSKQFLCNIADSDVMKRLQYCKEVLKVLLFGNKK